MLYVIPLHMRLRMDGTVGVVYVRGGHPFQVALSERFKGEETQGKGKKLRKKLGDNGVSTCATP